MIQDIGFMTHVVIDAVPGMKKLQADASYIEKKIVVSVMSKFVKPKGKIKCECGSICKSYDSWIIHGNKYGVTGHTEGEGIG